MRKLFEFAVSYTVNRNGRISDVTRTISMAVKSPTPIGVVNVLRKIERRDYLISQIVDVYDLKRIEGKDGFKKD